MPLRERAGDGEIEDDVPRKDDDELRAIADAAAAAAIKAHVAKKRQASGKTIGQLVDEWEPVAMRRRDWIHCSTNVWYVRSVTFEHEGKKTTLAKLPWDSKRPVFEAWLDAVRVSAGPTGKRRKPLKNGSINRIRGTVQTMFRHFVDEEVIGHNPIQRVKRESEKDGERRGYLTEEELERFLGYCRPVLAAMLRTAARCGGMRKRELRLLRKSEINWATREIILGGGRTKSGKGRDILLTDDVAAILKAQCELAPGEYVFPRPNDPSGGPISDSTLTDWMEAARKASRMTALGEKILIHTMRHVYAKAQLEKGMAVTHVMEQAGWSDHKIAARYMRLAGKTKETARAILNSRVTPPPSTSSYPCYQCQLPYPSPAEAIACLDRHAAAQADRHGPQGTAVAHLPVVGKRRA